MFLSFVVRQLSHPLLDLSSTQQAVLQRPSTPFNRAPPRDSRLACGGYTLGIKNTRNTTQLSCTERPEMIEKGETQNARGGIKVSDKESSQELQVNQNKKMKSVARRPGFLPETMPLLLNEGIKEPFSAGYLEMQIRFQPNQGMFCMCCMPSQCCVRALVDGCRW